MTVPRRTQAERRAATREALLDATIASLVEHGYARTTTRAVAERAGVTQGAQQHHFPTRAALVAEAVRHLAARLAAEVIESVLQAGYVEEAERVQRLLDLLWSVHRGPLFQAAVELFVASRTDPELAQAVRVVDADAADLALAGARRLVPALAAQPEFEDRMAVALTTVRGAALRMLTSEAEAEAEWQAARRYLLASLLQEA